MCLQLACRKNQTETDCAYLDTTSAAMDTTCDSGKVNYSKKVSKMFFY